MAEIIQFSEEPAQCGASKLTILKSRLRERFLKLLRRTGFPGQIQDAVIDDSLTGQHVEVKVGLYFTKISVNGRDYYFHRLTGRFDGTGMGCPDRFVKVLE